MKKRQNKIRRLQCVIGFRPNGSPIYYGLTFKDGKAVVKYKTLMRAAQRMYKVTNANRSTPYCFRAILESLFTILDNSHDFKLLRKLTMTNRGKQKEEWNKFINILETELEYRRRRKCKR